MKVGDTVHADIQQKKGPSKRCRGTITEIHGAVAKVNFWDGKRFFDEKMMTKDLQKE